MEFYKKLFLFVLGIGVLDINFLMGSTREPGVPVNLMWVNRDQKPEQMYIYQPKMGGDTQKVDPELVREEFLNQFVKRYLLRWADKNKNIPINIWVDGSLIHPDALANSRKAIEDYVRENKMDWAVIKLRDVRDIPLVNQSEDVFTTDVPVYFRVDLLRPIIALYMLENNETDRFVYTDLDVEPLSQGELFDDETMRYLRKFGIVMSRGGHLGFENSFQIISNYNENLLKAIKFALIDLNISKCRYFKQEYFKGIQELEQAVYDDYELMFAYFYSLQGYGKFQVAYQKEFDDAGEIAVILDTSAKNWPEYDIKSNGEPQLFFEMTNTNTPRRMRQKIWRFVPDDEHKNKIYFKSFKTPMGQARYLRVPTKKVKYPPSRFGVGGTAETSKITNFEGVDEL